MNKNESAENYLETILILSKRLPVVRSVDIAVEMNFKKSSISVAMKRLRENGYLTLDDNGHLILTGSGLAIAMDIYEKHQVLTRFLISIGVSEETARKDACRMEHVISQESFEKIKQLPYLVPAPLPPAAPSEDGPAPAGCTSDA